MASNPPNTKTIPDLFTALGDAMAEHALAEVAENEASKKLNTARTKLSEAQKAIDAAMKELRASAPWSTVWHEADRKGVSVG